MHTDSITSQLQLYRPLMDKNDWLRSKLNVDFRIFGLVLYYKYLTYILSSFVLPLPFSSKVSGISPVSLLKLRSLQEKVQHESKKEQHPYNHVIY